MRDEEGMGQAGKEDDTLRVADLDKQSSTLENLAGKSLDVVPACTGEDAEGADSLDKVVPVLESVLGQVGLGYEDCGGGDEEPGRDERGSQRSRSRADRELRADSDPAFEKPDLGAKAG